MAAPQAKAAEPCDPEVASLLQVLLGSRAPFSSHTLSPCHTCVMCHPSLLCLSRSTGGHGGDDMGSKRLEHSDSRGLAPAADAIRALSALHVCAFGLCPFAQCEISSQSTDFPEPQLLLLQSRKENLLFGILTGPPC